MEVTDSTVNSKTSPADIEVVHPVNVELVFFWAEESVGLAEAVIEEVVGNPEYVDFLISKTIEPDPLATSVHFVIVPFEGTVTYPFVPVVIDVPEPFTNIPIVEEPLLPE